MAERRTDSLSQSESLDSQLQGGTMLAEVSVVDIVYPLNGPNKKRVDGKICVMQLPDGQRVYQRNNGFLETTIVIDDSSQTASRAKRIIAKNMPGGHARWESLGEEGYEHYSKLADNFVSSHGPKPEEA